MLSSIEPIREAVTDIARWLITIPNPGEAIVRQAIVLRLLKAAGFDIWNPAMIVPEETNSSGYRPDLRIVAQDHEFIIELKGMNVGLSEKDYSQAVNYVAQRGLRWAILTNGKIWVVIDENSQGKILEREVLRIEFDKSDLDSFIWDIAELFDIEKWSSGKFSHSVKNIQSYQQQRKDVARVIKEFRPLVEETQKNYGIDTFENALSVSVRMGLITESQKDILTNPIKENPLIVKSVKKKEAKPKIKTVSSKIEVIVFHYQTGDAKAIALYKPELGQWTVKAGSTAIGEVKSYAGGVENRRINLIKHNKIEKLEDGRLHYVQDVDYDSPSSAAGDISGASKNGWDVWIDDLGRPAQFHRPKKQGLIDLS